MSRFLTTLDVELVNDTANDGRGEWAITRSLSFQSDLEEVRKILPDGIITAPIGFRTDYASVPRLPVVYWLAGDTAHPESVIHDYLYLTGILPRDVADAVFLEAMAATGVPAWRRYAMYYAVRAFGGAHFGPSYVA